MQLLESDPLDSYLAYLCKEKAELITKRYFGDRWDEDETDAYAFRHAYWNALMTVCMGEDLAKQFADAHEAPYLNSDYAKNREMDLYNNEVGRQISKEFKNLYGGFLHSALVPLRNNLTTLFIGEYVDNLLGNMIINAIKNGELQINRK